MALDTIHVVNVCPVTKHVTIGTWYWDHDKWRWVGSMTCYDWHESNYGIKYFSSEAEAKIMCAIDGIDLVDSKEFDLMYRYRTRNVFEFERNV